MEPDVGSMYIATQNTVALHANQEFQPIFIMAGETFLVISLDGATVMIFVRGFIARLTTQSFKRSQRRYRRITPWS